MGLQSRIPLSDYHFHTFPLTRSHLLGALLKLAGVLGENLTVFGNSRFSTAVVSSRSREEFEHG